jgi:FkbM family methyltransferase
MTTIRLQRLWVELTGFVRSLLVPNGKIEISLPDGMSLMAFHDYVGLKLATSGPWEPEVGKWIAEYSHVSRLFVDIGANLGYHTITQARRFESVVAFEPSPRTFNLLEENIRRNRLSNVQTWNVGLSDSEGKVKFVDVESSSGSSHFTNDEGIEGTMAKVTVFDKLVTSTPKLMCRAVVKIDVEGWERNVISGMANYIRLFKPVVLFEWDGRDKPRSDLEEISAIFGESYRFFSVDVPRPRWASSKFGYVLFRLVFGYGPATRIVEIKPSYYLSIAAVPSDLPSPAELKMLHLN